VNATLIGGKLVAKNGVSMVPNSPIAPPASMSADFGVSPGVTPAVFRVATAVPNPRIRAIEMINQTITAETILTVRSGGGAIEADVAQDLLKIAVFERHRGQGRVALGFLKGFGAKIGAIGLTINLDENALMIVGSDDEDMAFCANLLIDCGGGIALIQRRRTLDKLDLPIGGIASWLPWQEVGATLRRIQASMREMGSRFDRPLFALSFLTFVTLPSLRITSRGLVRAKERKIVSLFAE
jgi:adenine deaminase